MYPGSIGRWIALISVVSIWANSYAIATDDTKPDTVVLSPVIVIARPISELCCSVRFRYHLPGAGIKELVISKVPKWCATQGLSVDDLIVGVDGQAVAGKGLISFAKSLAAKFGPPPIKPTHFVFDVRSKDGGVLRKVDVVFDDSRGLTVAYP